MVNPKRRLKMGLKRNGLLSPEFPLKSLALTPYSRRFIAVEGIANVYGQNLQVGTLLNRKRWVQELRSFLMEMPDVYDAWNRELGILRKSRGK